VRAINVYDGFEKYNHSAIIKYLQWDVETVDIYGFRDVTALAIETARFLQSFFFENDFFSSNAMRYRGPHAHIR
jgi:hypothetical protein